jgi:hypothetical protein
MQPTALERLYFPDAFYQRVQGEKWTEFQMAKRNATFALGLLGPLFEQLIRASVITAERRDLLRHGVTAEGFRAEGRHEGQVFAITVWLDPSGRLQRLVRDDGGPSSPGMTVELWALGEPVSIERPRPDLVGGTVSELDSLDTAT